MPRATFQSVLDIILPSVKWKFVPVNLDDVFIFCSTPRQHIDHTRFALDLFQNANVTLKLNSLPSLKTRSITLVTLYDHLNL